MKARRPGLRARLMLSFTVLLAAILVAAAGLVIATARRAVAQEMDATVTLAATLLGTTLPARENAAELLRRLAPVGVLRHLCLRPVYSYAPVVPCSESVPAAPAWFAALVTPENPPAKRLRISNSRVALLIQADPADEIAEAWVDVRGLLGLIVLFYVLALVLAYRTLGRMTNPVARISTALDQVEHGDFAQRLPPFNLPEFDRIASRFNLMAGTLERARAENQRLHRHGLRIQETERAHLARELHDELGQSLTAIRADAAGILAQRERLSAEAVESAQAIADVAGRIYDQTRIMMRRLRPPGLDELGLAAALEENLTGWRRLYPKVDYRLAVAGELDALDPELAINTFRIVQEALTNAHRHAQPDSIAVDLRLTAEDIRITVADNGRGFDVGSTPAGMGISGMRERAELLGGSVEIASQAGGTRVLARLPAK